MVSMVTCLDLEQSDLFTPLEQILKIHIFIKKSTELVNEP